MNRITLWNLKFSDFKGMSSDKTNCKIKMNWLSEQFVQDGICIFVKTSRTSSIVRRLFTFKGNWNLSNDESLTEGIWHVSIKFSSIVKHLSTEAPALLEYWIIQIVKLLVVSLSNTCHGFSICTLCFTISNVSQKSYFSCCSQSCLLCINAFDKLDCFFEIKWWAWSWQII